MPWPPLPGRTDSPPGKWSAAPITTRCLWLASRPPRCCSSPAAAESAIARTRMPPPRQSRLGLWCCPRLWEICRALLVAAFDGGTLVLLVLRVGPGPNPQVRTPVLRVAFASGIQLDQAAADCLILGGRDHVLGLGGQN